MGIKRYAFANSTIIYYQVVPSRAIGKVLVGPQKRLNLLRRFFFELNLLITCLSSLIRKTGHSSKVIIKTMICQVIFVLSINKKIHDHEKSTI
jgi:hypothetical protein